MKTLKKLTGSLLSIFILFAVLLSTLSCEIGLGASVDTDPPSLSIDASIVDSTIAGDFDIEGTYSDDGSIEDIHAVLKRTDGTGSSIKIEGYLGTSPEKRGEGIWKIPVKAKTSEITDGSYQVTVSIKDGVGRVTTQSTTFTIDNTPPVLILTKPNSNPGDETVSAYGQRVFLEGSIADTAKETYITVEFFDNPSLTGTPLDVIKTSAIAPTDVNSNNAKLTIYKEDSYDKIYRASAPNKKEGSKDVYIKITAEDIAGNSTTDFYFSKDLAKNITKSSGEDAFGLAPIDIYNILNKTDALKNKERSAADVTKIKELLSANAKQKAMFSLNPENSPYFTVSGMKTLTKSGKDFESSDNGYWVINGAQTLEVSVFMGSDSIELVDDENFYVYLLQCDENGDVADGYDVDANRIKLYSKSRETGSGANKKTYYSIGGKQTHKTTAGAYVFTLPMSRTLKVDPDKTGTEGFVNQNLEYGKNYIIRVSGKDNEGNPVEPNETGYGFHFTTGGGAPILNLTEPSPDEGTIFLKKGDAFILKGSTKSDEGVPQVTVWNGTTKIADIPLETELEGEFNDFTYTIPASVFKQDGSDIYSIIVKASRGTDSNTETKFSVWYDIAGPDIKVNSIQPVVNRNGKNNINGTVTLKGTIIDSFDQFGSATWKVVQNGSVVAGIGGSIGSSFEINLDTTKLTDKKDAEIVIEAYDRAKSGSTASYGDRSGNKSEWKTTYYVDQETDKPLIENNTSSVDITKGEDESILENGKNLFIRGGTLVLSVSDDDSVESAEVILQKKLDNGSFDAPNTSDITKTLYNTYEKPSVISHTLPNTVGFYRTTVTVFDEKYTSKTATPNNYSTVTFMLRVTGTGPDVTITPEKDYISTLLGQGSNKLTFKISGTATDVYKLYADEVLKKSDQTSPFEYTVTYDQGVTEADDILFKVTDSQGFTEKIFTPRFDNDLPAIDITNYPTDPVQTEESTYLFKGSMSDETSGIKEVKIKFINGNTPSDIEAAKNAADGWNSCICGSTSWNYDAEWGKLGTVFTSEGQKTVIVKAIDEAGNSQTQAKSFIYDKMKPEIVSVTGAETTTGADVVLTIKMKDTNPVAPQVKVQQNGLDIQPTVNVVVTNPVATGTANEYSSTATIPFNLIITSDGTYEIEVTAKDANNRTSTQKYHRIIRDSSAPAITFTSPASASPAFIRKSSYKFTGTITDANDITNSEITLYKKASGSETTDTKIGDTETISLSSDGNWAYQFYELEPGIYYVKVYAKDIAGNERNLNSDTVSVDNNPPLVTLSHTGLRDAAGNAISSTTALVPGTTYYANGDFTINGLVSDLNFEYSTELVGITSSPAQTLTVTSSAADKFSFKPAAYKDGNYAYTIKVQDKAGNTAEEITIRVWLDKTGPTVTIKNPSENIIDSTKALDDATYSFRINATDNSGGVGVASLSYAFSQSSSAPAADSKEWVPESFSGGDINIDMYLIPGKTPGTAPYSQLCEGTWYLYAKAIDKSGNETSSITRREFPIDKANPSLTVENLNESGVNPLYAEIANDGYIISGSVSDTNGLPASGAVKISVDNQAEENATVNTSTGAWSYKIQTETTAGKLKFDEPVVVKVTAYDVTGKKDSKTYTLYYDTKDPELEVAAPVSGEAVASASKEIKGTVSDGGYGIKKLEYKLYKGATNTVIDSGSTEGTNPKVIIKGEQWYISGDGKISLGDDQGALRLVVTATENDNGKTGSEKSGGREKEEEISFYYDEAAPSLTETGINTTGKTTNTNFTLSGNAADTNALASMTISWGTNNSITLTPGQEQLKNWNWSKEFVVGSTASGTNKVADGTNEFTIIAKDIAGKEKTLSRTVVVDTTQPTVETITVDTTGGTTIGSDIWYKTTSVPVTVAVSDSGTGSAFSAGISKVEYQAGSGNWVPLSKTGDNYSGTINFSGNGTQTLNLKVTDVAGNESTVKPTTVHIDTTAPSLSALYYKKGTASAEAVDASVSSIYVKSNTQLTVYGNYEDAESGVNALAFAYGSPTVTYSETAIGVDAPSDTAYTISSVTGKETSIKSWKAVFTPSASGAFIVNGSNRTTNPTGTLKVFDVTVDGELPVVDNVKLIEVKDDVEKQAYSDGSKYFVNNKTTGKTFKISGVATDNVGVDSVELLITKNDTTTTKTATRKGSLGQWYFDGIDLSDWTGTGAKVKITVKDKAGNEASEETSEIVEFNIAFDVTAPATTHKIDDSQKNLEFRIGDAPNDEDQEDVGGKYSNGSYGSALTMQLRGNFPDNEGGSGINKFYYKTFNNLEVKIDQNKENEYEEGDSIYFKDDAALIDYVVKNKTDIFSPIAVEPKNVEYNIGPYEPETWVTVPTARVRFGGSATTAANASGQYKSNKKGYVQFRTSVDTNFKTIMKGFVEGKNYLVIVAEDNAGNLGLDTATVGGVEYPCYSLNVDITAPTIPATQEGTLYTNVVKKLESDDPNPDVTVMISGTVSDKPNKDKDSNQYIAHGSSGIKEIVFTSNQNSESVKLTGEELHLTSDEIAAAIEANPSAEPAPTAWTVDVRPLLARDGTAIISAKVTDNAGFESSKPVANITVDKTGPTVTINSPAANAIVGKKFTISGIANDGNGAGVDTASGLELWYKVASGDWTKYTTSNPTLTGQNWTCDVNASFVNNGANTAVSFKVSAKDKSGTGNPGESTELAVTVDTKAPVAGTFNVEETAAANLGSTWFNSTTVNINGTFTDAGGSGVKKVYYQVNSGDEKSVTSDGSYTINIKDLATGSNTIKIYAEDSVGNKSGASPYTVKVDGTTPVVQKKSKDLDSTYRTNGSKAQKIDFYVNEVDSGIPVEAAKYTLKLGSSAVALTKVDTLAGEAATGNLIVIGNSEGTGADTKYPIEIQLGTSAFTNLSGSQPVTITVTDNAGNPSVATIIGTMDIDSTPPVPSFTSPSANSKVNKEVEIKGKITEKNGIDSITLTATYGTGNNTKTKTFTYSKDGENNTITFDKNEKEWSVTFDSNVADWNDSNTAQTWTFSVIATDDAGNTSGTSTRNYIIDQNSDRPVIKFSNLDISSMTSSNRVWITKEDLYASINDDDGDVQTVEVSFDGNNWSSKDSDNVPYYTPENGLSYPMPTKKDGEQTIYFRVKDAAGETFTSSLTSDAADTSAPKLAYKTTEFGDTTGKYYSVIYAKVDLGDPSIPLAYYTTATDETAPVANNALLTLLKKDDQNKLTDELTETAKQTWKDLSGVKTAVGGTTKYIYILTKAKDANGINAVSAKFNN